MPDTMTLISAVTVGAGGASTIDFTSIPSTYNNLCLKFSIRDSRSSAGPGYLHLKFNDSTSGYSSKFVYTSTDDGSIGNSSRTDDYISFAINTNFSTSSAFGNGELYIPNYTSANTKSVCADSVSETNSSYNAAVRNFTSFFWANSAAITKISLYGDASPFLQYSTAYLYGIKNS